MFREKKLSTKLLFMFLSVAIITTSLLTGTLAVFSATYIWQSTDAIAGTFDFEDTVLLFDLFGDKAVLPADFGSKVLDGADFGDKTISWGFSETNASNIPMLFYVSDGANFSGFYSAYDFATEFPTYYVKRDATNFVACSEISISQAEIATELGLGFELCWVWPDKLFSLGDTSYTEVASDTKVSEYIENNENLCKTLYKYDYENPDVLVQLCYSQNALSHIATAKLANGFSMQAITPISFSISNGKLFSNGSFIPIFCASSDSFIIPDASYTLLSDDYYLFYSNVLTVNRLLTNFTASNLDFEVVGNTVGDSNYTPYYINGVGSEIATIDNGNTAKPIIKLFPNKISLPAPSISVKITAEVSI